ncbi:YopX family protein [Parabacteroides merdae]|jgi:uncharacterized phage protein (TIGR01671 family)|uniref:YopX family protein n=1 Tax=Parabacteroides merdae TaxID=46503 RepID=UPI0034A37C76
MRNIIFRGKTADEWVYGDLSHEMYHGEVKMFVNGILVEQDTIGQFTGFNDKNKTEIYEDDIIRFYINGKEYIISVRFNNEVGAWCATYKASKYMGTRPLGELLCEYCDMEVIGNIHDNPELFKQKNNE